MTCDYVDLKSKKILVAGLGLIGGSIALSLKRAGYTVYGWNRSAAPIEYAKKHSVIDDALAVSDADIIFLCLPPEACVCFLEDNHVKDGAYVYDICGVKGFMEKEIYSKDRNFLYVGCHPMAGKEVSGVENASADLFDRASMVLTSCERTDAVAYRVAVALTVEMGFARLVECCADVHDAKIAYTSQLAHVVSNAYVRNDEILACNGFTGGSFQDMTRIAGVDEKVWAELYTINRDNLTRDIDGLCEALSEISEAVKSGDKDRVAEVLSLGRRLFESGSEGREQDGIKITSLKYYK